MGIVWVNRNRNHRERGNWESACGRWIIAPGTANGYRRNKHNESRLLPLFRLTDSRGDYQQTFGLVGELKKRAALYAFAGTLAKEN